MNRTWCRVLAPVLRLAELAGSHGLRTGGFGYLPAARHAPLLPVVDSYAFLDVDSTISRVYGYAKQGADYRYIRARSTDHPQGFRYSLRY